MRNLRPVGEAINFDDKERRLLFTLNVVDQIQEHYDMSIQDVINKLFGREPEDRRKSYSILKYVVTALVNEDVEIHNEEASSDEKWNMVTEKYIGRKLSLENTGIVSLTVLKAYTKSLPDIEEEEDDPNQTSGQ